MSAVDFGLKFSDNTESVSLFLIMSQTSRTSLYWWMCVCVCVCVWYHIRMIVKPCRCTSGF